MGELLKLYIITLIVWACTLIFLTYGFIFHDSNIFFMGDVLGLFLSAMMYGLYVGAYNEYFK